MRVACHVLFLVLLLAMPAHAFAQVVTQLARENTKIPRGERPDDEPRRVGDIEVNVDTASVYYLLLDSAQVMIDRQQWADAERYFARAIATEPSHPSNSLLLSNLATLQRYQGRLDEAVKNYTMALDLTPNAVTLLLNRAAAYVQLGDNARAAADYERVRLLDPADAESRYSLGMMAVEARDFERARELFGEIRRANPKSALADEGEGLMSKEQGDHDKAIRLLGEAIKAAPDARLLANRADCYLARKQLNLADEDIRAALSMTPDDPYLYVLRAKLNKLRFNRRDMQLDIDRAVALGLERAWVDTMLN